MDRIDEAGVAVKEMSVLELTDDTKTRISRPRQIYTGSTLRHFVPMKERQRELVTA